VRIHPVLATILGEIPKKNTFSAAAPRDSNLLIPKHVCRLVASCHKKWVALRELELGVCGLYRAQSQSESEIKLVDVLFGEHVGHTQEHALAVDSLFPKPPRVQGNAPWA
jgi:hypothetical protein